jgi:DNA-binding beta-propeller fold protein YncE
MAGVRAPQERNWRPRHLGDQDRELMRTYPLALLALLAFSGCGDPLFVLGDAPGYMRVVLGIGESPGNTTHSDATRARVTEPTGLAFAEVTGLLYVGDRGATRTFLGITSRVARIMTVSSAGEFTLVMDAGGCIGALCIHEATQMVRAPNGALLIADAIGHRVVRYDPVGKSITVLAGTGTAGAAPDGAVAVQAQVDAPSGIALAADGTIYFTERGANRVRLIDGGNTLRTVAALAGPTGLALHEGTLFVSEAGANRVRAITLSSGAVTTAAGNGTPGFGGDGGLALEARLASPRALSVSPDGATLFIADRDNHRVRAVALATGLIRTFAGSGSTVFAGNRMAAGAASLRTPAGVLVSERGFLFIGDTGHSVVWRATLTL